MIGFLAAAKAPDVVVFVVAAALVVGGALGVVLNRNPVHSALSLVTTLFGVAVLFIEQEAHFLAAVQVIVYAGAIVVLFLFVIMLLGVDKVELMKRDKIPAQRPLGLLMGAGLLVLVVALARWNWKATGASSVGGKASGPGSNVGKLADSLFTQYLFAFEATSLLLVIAVIGAVVLSRRPPPDLEDESNGEISSVDETESELEGSGK